MKVFFCFCTLLFAALLGRAQVLDCQKFNIGTFYYPEIPDYGYTVRDKDTQRSYVAASKIWIHWKLKWTSACDFELRFDHSDNDGGTFKKGDKILATITEIEGDCYTFIGAFFDRDNPNGKPFPPGKMCLKKD